MDKVSPSLPRDNDPAKLPPIQKALATSRDAANLRAVLRICRDLGCTPAAMNAYANAEAVETESRSRRAPRKIGGVR